MAHFALGGMRRYWRDGLVKARWQEWPWRSGSSCARTRAHAPGDCAEEHPRVL